MGFALIIMYGSGLCVFLTVYLIFEIVIKMKMRFVQFLLIFIFNIVSFITFLPFIPKAKLTVKLKEAKP